MKLLLSAVIALVVICRLAAGGEGVTLNAADPIVSIIRLIADLGALGTIAVFYFTQQRRDMVRREKDNERWHHLDRELMALVRECTKAIAEFTNTAGELRKDVWRLMRKSGAHSRRESETDTYTK